MTRGTVSLVALCFVAVLGISLAGYIAVCSRAMTLSNRSFQSGLSKQLAEAGVEEALRAFNKNDWSDWSSNGYSADWSLDTANRRATAALNFPTGKFGQGTTATVTIRVDNYDAPHLGATWSGTKTYRINDLVGHNGIWYRSLKNDNFDQNPSAQTRYEWWIPAPIKWAWCSNVSYLADHDIVNYQGDWWLCAASHTSGSVFNSSNWTWIPAPSLTWSSSTWYNLGAFVYHPSDNTWYRCTSAHFSTGSFEPANFTRASWEYQASTLYAFGSTVNYGGSWYHYINSSPASGITPGSNSAYWENALSGATHGWNSEGITYNLGATVYYNGQWYRCIRTNTSSGSTSPANTAYWVNTPLLSSAWDSGKQYSQNDTVRYNGVWYRSLQDANIAKNPSTETNYWIGANTTDSSHQWNAASNYATGNYRCYGGVWYRCVASHSNRSPNDAAYWQAEGAAVVYADATVTITNSPAVRTQLRCPVAPSPLFPNAAAATNNLTITTGTGTVDSYDQLLGTGYAAQVNNPTTNYSAVLAAGSALSIQGTTAVRGYLAWATPPSGLSTGTTVKGPSSPATNIDPARVSRSAYIPQPSIHPSVSLSLSTNWAVVNKGVEITDPTSSNQTLTLGTPGALVPSRYHYDGDLRLEPGETGNYRYIHINGPVILYIQNSLRIQGGGMIQINSTGSAQITYGTYFRAYTGSAGIYNRTQDPKALMILTNSTSSQLTFWDNGGSSTNKDFYGTVYAPNITPSLGLEFRDGINFYGAISAKNVTFSSEANLHYDISLRYATIPGVDQPYAATEWRELPATEQATIP